MTIVLERPVEVDVEESELNQGRYFWIDPRALEGLDEPLRTEAPASLDLVVAAIAPILGPGVFNGGTDRFFFTAKDRGPVFFPRFSANASLTTGNPTTAFPFDALRDRIAELGLHGQPWLRRVSHWYLAMLDTQDRWKRFQWGYLGLEVLTHKLADRIRAAALQALQITGADGAQAPYEVLEPIIWEQKRMPLASQFALMAAYLSPITAEEDVAAFRVVRKARDAISHGEPIDHGDLPVQHVEELLPRYFELALKAAAN